MFGAISLAIPSLTDRRALCLGRITAPHSRLGRHHQVLVFGLHGPKNLLALGLSRLPVRVGPAHLTRCPASPPATPSGFGSTSTPLSTRRRRGGELLVTGSSPRPSRGGGSSAPRSRDDAGEPRPTIEVRQLSKWFGSVVALSDLTFDVGPGVTALLGPNGAGKSTLFRVLCGLANPSQGTVRIFGEDPRGTRP